MTNYEKLKKKYRITILILIAGIMLLILSISTKNAKIMSILGPLAVAITIVDFIIFKRYKRTIKQAETIKIGTEQAIKDINNTNDK